MEFHIPYFALRSSSPKDYPQTVANSPLRERIDISFLQMKYPNSLCDEKNTIYEAQFSFVICGEDDTRWVAYAFADTALDDDNLADNGFSDEAFRPDPILPSHLDANLPIWDPRHYFLRILEFRITQLLSEWEYLVRTIERRIRRYVCCFVLLLTSKRSIVG